MMLIYVFLKIAAVSVNGLTAFLSPKFIVSDLIILTLFSVQVKEVNRGYILTQVRNK